jgi:hypothetical protein
MAIELDHATAGQRVPLGPFLSDTDGKTPLTGLTIANTDIKVWKNGGTSLVNKSSGGATHMANGVYYATLDATDTNAAGPLVLFVHMSGALPIRVECAVALPGRFTRDNYWRHMVYFQATGTPTATTIPIGATSYSDLPAWTNNGAYVGMQLMSLFQYSAVSRVTAYNGATKVLTVEPALPFTPAVGDAFMLVPGAPGVLADNAVSAAKVAADAVTELQSGLATAAALATVSAYVDELESRLTAARAGYLDTLNTGVPLSAATIDAILDEVVEGTITLRQAQRLMLASLVGKASGGGTTTVNFRDLADTKNRVVMTTDANGNRTAVTRDAT